MNDDDLVAVNRATWDGKVDSHVVAYQAEAFADDPSALSDVVKRDLELMTPFLPSEGVAGLALVHLQCHIGTDTLSWARLGARVTGVDISGAAIQAATRLATRAGLDARFVESTNDAAPETLGEQFDVVYTGIGAITWLPDLAAWAAAIFSLLEPGGLFFVRDGHPMLYTIDFERDDGTLAVTLPYFGDAGAQRSDDGLTYATDGEASTTYEWAHPISEIVGSLLGAGLELLAFDEQQDIPWRALPEMIDGERGMVLPTGRDRLPLTFSLAARKPLA